MYWGFPEVFQKIKKKMIRPHFGLKISQLPAPITISRFEFNRAKISELRRSTGECDTGIESIVTLYSQKIKKKIDPTTFWSQNQPVTSTQHNFAIRIQSCKDLRAQKEYGGVRYGDREHCYSIFPENLKKIDPTTFWSQNRPITSAHSLQNVIS